MMIKHRKLFPKSEDNTTLPCPDICVLTCPYGCNPYVDVYSVPPPPPPLPSQNSPSTSTKQSEHISPFVIVIVTLLASCFILISLYLLAVRFRSRWNIFRPLQRRQGQPQANNNQEFLDENHGPTAIDYPIWYINTIGLQTSVIDSITIFRYKKGDNLIEATECSVCLNEFQNDDTLRLLPKCSHAFHIPCIDTWLRSHINCPVCRAGIVSSTATSTPVASNALNFNNLRPNQDSQAENQENGEVLNINHTREEGFLENRTDTEEIIEVQQVDQDGQDVDVVKVNVIPKGTSASWLIEDSDDKRMIGVGNNEQQSVRRSVSVDSILAPDVTVCLSECEDTSVLVDQIADACGDSSKNLCENSRTVRNPDGSSLVTQLLHRRPVRMKRSFSHPGGSLFSRQRSRGNLVLSLSCPEIYQFPRMAICERPIV